MSHEGIQHGRLELLHTNSHCQQCTIKYTAKYTYLMSWHMEVTLYHPEFPECRESKPMCKQYIPGPFLQFSNWPGTKANNDKPSIVFLEADLWYIHTSSDGQRSGNTLLTTNIWKYATDNKHLEICYNHGAALHTYQSWANITHLTERVDLIMHGVDSQMT